VAERTAGTKTLRHPVAGELTLDWSTLTDAADPDQQLIALTATPGTSSHDGLRLLASWAAEPRRPDGRRATHSTTPAAPEPPPRRLAVSRGSARLAR
jgi:transcription regulator MmyB-like protein